MNSILQCLSNTRELRDYCLQRLYMRDLSHSSNVHTALMEGEEPGPDPCPAPLLVVGCRMYPSYFSFFGFFLVGF